MKKRTTQDDDYIYTPCPFGCGHVETTEITNTGRDLAQIAARNKIGLHMLNCPNNPERQESELDKLKKTLFEGE